MVESIVGLYALICWLVFKKFKLVPVNTYTIFTAILIGGAILGLLYVLLSIYHPASHDGRMYAPVVQIVPQVRGTVIEVPVEANKLVKKGEVLFRLDPTPYQFEVDRLRAVLAGKNRNFADALDRVAAAEAATREARAKLEASESVNDRQLLEARERAAFQVEKIKERLKLAQIQFGRQKELMAQKAVSQQDYDRAQTLVQTLEQELGKAESDERNAAEQLKSGSATLKSDVEALSRLEAEERRARLAVTTLIEGKDGKQVTPEERETMALLDKARWDLEQTVVRAPSDGYVPQQVLRPGMMAVSLPFKPLMVFVVGERPTLVASYPQKVVSNVKPGMHGEATFKQYPGRSFKVTVRRVLTAVSEGELDAGGRLLSPTAEDSHGYIPVVFDYEDDIAELNLPVGAQATVAIYTDKVHALSFLRMIILRIHSWENYVF